VLTGAPGVIGQDGQHDAVPRSQSVRLAVDGEWAEYGDAHVSECRPASGAGQRRDYRTDTAAAPDVYRSAGQRWHDVHTTREEHVMTTAAIKQTHQVSLRSIGLALGGVVLAVGAGFGAAAVMLDDDPPATVPEQTYFPGSDIGTGTDRQDRELMHRLGADR
jgi:hypothetical protein